MYIHMYIYCLIMIVRWHRSTEQWFILNQKETNCLPPVRYVQGLVSFHDGLSDVRLSVRFIYSYSSWCQLCRNWWHRDYDADNLQERQCRYGVELLTSRITILIVIWDITWDNFMLYLFQVIRMILWTNLCYHKHIDSNIHLRCDDISTTEIGLLWPPQLCNT